MRKPLLLKGNIISVVENAEPFWLGFLCVESIMGAVAYKLRFLSPLIKPDVRSYRIWLSDWRHLMAHGGRLFSSALARVHTVHRILFPMKTDGCPVTASCAASAFALR
jgi:hypothetical protein